jgi:hypothetical protein
MMVRFTDDSIGVEQGVVHVCKKPHEVQRNGSLDLRRE